VRDRRRLRWRNADTARDDVTPVKDFITMKSSPVIVAPVTNDSGRIRLGGGWRLPTPQPTR